MLVVVVGAVPPATAAYEEVVIEVPDAPTREAQPEFEFEFNPPDAAGPEAAGPEAAAEALAEARAEAGGAPKANRRDPDVVVPISDEEKNRRHSTPSEQVQEEEWYQVGKAVFVAKCSACHPAGTNKIKKRKSLFREDMVRNGYDGEEKMMQLMRYGNGKMPGFARDCSEIVDVNQCNKFRPISDSSLRDVQDFIINRMNADWKGRG